MATITAAEYEQLRALLAKMQPAATTAPDPPGTETRECTICHALKPLTEQYFRPQGRWYRYQCRKCCNKAENRGKGRARVEETSSREVEKQPSPSPYSGKARIAEEYRAAVAPEPPPVPVDGTRLYVGLFDIHRPYSDPWALDAVIDWIRDMQPQGCVVGGDFLDFYELSSFNRGKVARLEGHRVSDTFDSGNELFDRLDDASKWEPDSRRVLWGNHEGRLLDWLNTGDNAAWMGDDSVSIKHRLKLDGRGWIAHEDERAVIKLGRLGVTHGHLCGLYPAARHVNYYRHSIMVGHVHHRQVVTVAALNGPQVGITVPFLGDPSSVAFEYGGKHNNWQHGFGVVTVRPDGSFEADAIGMWDRSFTYAGKRYGKRPLVQVP
jgi:hypothetical protein